MDDLISMDLSDPETIKRITSNMKLNGEIVDDAAAHRNFWASCIVGETRLEFTLRPKHKNSKPRVVTGKFSAWHGFSYFIWVIPEGETGTGINPRAVTNVAKLQ